MSEVTIAFWVGLVVGTLQVYLAQYFANVVSKHKEAKRLREKALSDWFKKIDKLGEFRGPTKHMLAVAKTISALRKGEAQILCSECGNLNSFQDKPLPFICSECGNVIIPANWMEQEEL